MKISFCTTCFNRAYQFRQTFENNCAIISREKNVEWVILNLNSKDGLHEYMMNKLPSFPQNIVYAKETATRFWHVSVAKNMAHRIGSGDVLVNLDCDNFIGNTLDLIRGPLSNGTKAIHLWSGISRDGTCGRIAIVKSEFFSLGGYDESFFPIGHDDLDLLKRARKSGLSVERHPCASNLALRNTKKVAIKYCQLGSKLTWEQCCKRNRQKSNKNIEENHLIANIGKNWGSGNLEIFRWNQEVLKTDIKL
jgi:hypothetical protein